MAAIASSTWGATSSSSSSSSSTSSSFAYAFFPGSDINNRIKQTMEMTYAELQNFNDLEIDAVPEDSAERISPIDGTIKDRALMGVYIPLPYISVFNNNYY